MSNYTVINGVIAPVDTAKDIAEARESINDRH